MRSFFSARFSLKRRKKGCPSRTTYFRKATLSLSLSRLSPPDIFRKYPGSILTPPRARFQLSPRKAGRCLIPRRCPELCTLTYSSMRSSDAQRNIMPPYMSSWHRATIVFQRSFSLNNAVRLYRLNRKEKTGVRAIKVVGDWLYEYPLRASGSHHVLISESPSTVK